jgi:hypothetical protein
MKSRVRCPLVCLTALAAYVVVHVFAGVLHHHGTAHWRAQAPTADTKSLGFQTFCPGENEQEESCLLCSVLHLAQIPATALSVDIIAVLNGEAPSATAIIRPHPPATAIYSRGPPSVRGLAGKPPSSV